MIGTLVFLAAASVVLWAEARWQDRKGGGRHV